VAMFDQASDTPCSKSTAWITDGADTSCLRV
jgi:hypothetical protein